MTGINLRSWSTERLRAELEECCRLVQTAQGRDVTALEEDIAEMEAELERREYGGHDCAL